MVWQTPKLTAAEEKKLGKACMRRDRKARAVRDAADGKLQALEEEYRRRRNAIEAKCSAALQAVSAEYRDFEDAIFDAIFTEEERSGVKRDRAPVDMVRWYRLAGGGHAQHIADSYHGNRE